MRHSTLKHTPTTHLREALVFQRGGDELRSAAAGGLGVAVHEYGLKRQHDLAHDGEPHVLCCAHLRPTDVVAPVVTIVPHPPIARAPVFQDQEVSADCVTILRAGHACTRSGGCGWGRDVVRDGRPNQGRQRTPTGNSCHSHSQMSTNV